MSYVLSSSQNAKAQKISSGFICSYAHDDNNYLLRGVRKEMMVYCEARDKSQNGHLARYKKNSSRE